MLAVDTEYKHIILNNDNIPIIEGTTIKVIELVLDNKAYGWSPEELHFQHPCLTLGQIYSAFVYYWDHQQELEQDISRRLRFIEQVKQSIESSPLEQRLKAKGLL